MENPLTSILYKIITTPTLYIFLNTLDILQKSQQSFGYQIWFCTRLLNGWWVITQTSKGLVYTQGHTHRQTQARTIPRGQNWPWVKLSPGMSKLIGLSHHICLQSCKYSQHGKVKTNLKFEQNSFKGFLGKLIQYLNWTKTSSCGPCLLRVTW